MDSRYTGRDYNYSEVAKQPWSSTTGLPEEDNNNHSQGDTHGDILQNFPYLRHGFSPRFSQSQQDVSVATAAHGLNSRMTVKDSYSQRFASASENLYSNVNPVPHYMDGMRSQEGRLPDVSTFNTSLSQMQHQMNNPVAATTFSSSEGAVSHKAYEAARQNLTTSSGLVGQGSCAMTNQSNLSVNSSEQNSSQSQSLPSIYHVINNDSTAKGIFSSHAKTLDTYRATSAAANSASDSFHGDGLEMYDSGDISLRRNTTATPLETANNFNPATSVMGDSTKNPNYSGSRNNLPYGGMQNQCENVKSGNRVKFIWKGMLSPKRGTSLKSRSEVLREPVDSEESFFDNIVFNMTPSGQKDNNTQASRSNLLNRSYEYKPSYKKTAMKLYESKLLQNEPSTYTEPSIAELRQGAMKIENGTFRNYHKDFGLRGSSDGNSKLSQTSDGLENSNDFEAIDGDLNYSWYSSAINKYASIGSDEAADEMPSPIKRGGRSDPDNPFAITSPSFSESAARAVVTTTNCSTGTIVSISIMSIGSRKKLIPSITNSEAARGGLVSIANPIETTDDSNGGESDETGEVKKEQTSIMSKLNREKKEKEEAEEESKDTNIDHLDVEVHIEDTQCIDHGDQKRWQCKLCPKLYTTKHNLVAHILDHGGIKPHLCLVCGKYFKQLSHLNTHMLTHDMVKPHKCTICNKGFTQVSHLKRHQTVHMETKPQTYTCSTCNRGFAFPSELRAHQERHLQSAGAKEVKVEADGQTGDDNLKCCYCKRVFKFPSQLRDHMLTHAGARPYICTECGMDFMKDHHLKAHLFTHTGLRPYSCPHCSRSFNQKANMVRHMLIHNSERAFKCEVCSKTFTQPQTLKAHMVVHADKKPYSCKFCGKQFGRLHNLQGHLHIHSDSKPYMCSICQSTFTLKGNLNRHKKVKHGLNESTENMEEDAVNFLSSLSDRVRDSSVDADQDSRGDDSLFGEMSSPSLKKGRKSVPRKRVTQNIYMDKDAEGDGSDWEGASDDAETDEKTAGASYSDEERENEERLGNTSTSMYFAQQDDGQRPRRKRKQNICYRFEGDDGEHVEEDNDASNDTIDLDYNIVKKEVESSDDIGNEGLVEDRRPVRKRKKKQLEEGFIDEDLYDEDDALIPAKASRKGDKLDTIIATKFNNV